MTPLPPSRSPRRLPVLIGGLFFCTCLAFQTFVASTCLLTGQGCLLTWTMYSGLGDYPDVFVQWETGGETQLSRDKGIRGIGRVLGAKIDTARFVPPYLCENFPDAQAIRLAFPDTRPQEIIPCRH